MMNRLSFLLVLLVVCVGVVLGQCKDENPLPVSYQGQNGPCGLESLIDKTIYKCKNFFGCRYPHGNHTTPYCEASPEPVFADFPYGHHCFKNYPGAYQCPFPLVCNQDSRRCDYKDLPNGYHCKRDDQCASNYCSIDGFPRVCVRQIRNPSESCEADSDCPPNKFCNQTGLCAKSMALGDNCTGFENSLDNTISRVCEPGTGCLPGHNSSDSYTCQRLFSGKYENYCGDSRYKCGYGQYCNQQTNKCDILQQYDGTNLPHSCSNSSSEACPSGFKCSCAGEHTEDGYGTCKKYINTMCPSLFQKYLSCLEKNQCYFDQNTLINNPETNTPDFIQPLNRFSCAQQCQFQYNKFVKCQNQGFEENNTLTPAYVPKFSHHDDAIWKGWEVALLTVGVLVCMVVLAGLSVLFCRPEPDLQDLE